MQTVLRNTCAEIHVACSVAASTDSVIDRLEGVIKRPIRLHVHVCRSMSARKWISQMAQKTLIVLVDLDQTLADFEGHFLKKFREQYPEEPFIPLEDRRTFYLGEQYDMINDGMKDRIRGIYRREGFFRDLPAIPGGIEAVKEMNEMESVEVFLCSSPLFQYQYSAKEKYEWVENHLGQDFINKVILTRDKTMIQGNLLIDDKPSITGAIENPSWEHILFTACHNKHMKRHKAHRLDNWTDGGWRELIMDRLKRL